MQQIYLFLNVSVYFIEILAQVRWLQDMEYFVDIGSQAASSLFSGLIYR